MRRLSMLCTLALACHAGALGARADTAADAYRAQGIKPQDVLSGTVLTARVLPGPDKQVVAMTTYFTGSQDRAKAVDVKFTVFTREGQSLQAIYNRDFGHDLASPVGQGDLEVVDLDHDGVNEIVVSFESFADPLIQQRSGEILTADASGFRTAWSGEMAYDATRAARDVPRERRDRFTREIDVPATLRSKGTTLFLKKKVVAVAGERLAQPQIVDESFPLHPAAVNSPSR
jgi:hypothetical protein